MLIESNMSWIGWTVFRLVVILVTCRVRMLKLQLNANLIFKFAALLLGHTV
jgi:hypothetical protein